MREIKFRAWDGKEYEFFSLESITQDESYRTYLGNLKMNDNTVIEQYTGLKDKKGKEIFEGDLVKESGIVVAIGKDTIDLIGTVKWCEGSAGFHVVFEHIEQTSYITSTMEICGNIHENLTSSTEKSILDKEVK